MTTKSSLNLDWPRFDRDDERDLVGVPLNILQILRLARTFCTALDFDGVGESKTAFNKFDTSLCDLLASNDVFNSTSRGSAEFAGNSLIKRIKSDKNSTFSRPSYLNENFLKYFVNVNSTQLTDLISTSECNQRCNPLGEPRRNIRQVVGCVMRPSANQEANKPVISCDVIVWTEGVNNRLYGARI